MTAKELVSKLTLHLFKMYTKYFRYDFVLDIGKLINKCSEFLVTLFEKLLLNEQNDLLIEKMYKEFGVKELC